MVAGEDRGDLVQDALRRRHLEPPQGLPVF
jgi:hypothetical protein